jgi:hypothetical protein
MDNLPQTLEELNVKYFKLMNGESIISYVHELDGETYGAQVGLEEPMAVVVTGNDEYSFTPWFPFTSGKVHMLDTYNIISEGDVDNHMKAYYMKLVLKVLDPASPSDSSDDATGKVLH